MKFMGRLTAMLAMLASIVLTPTVIATADPGADASAAGWAAEWMVGRDDPYTAAEAAEIARRFDVIAAQPWTFKDVVPAMRAANPDLVLYAYVNGPFARSWGVSYPDGWYAKNAQGQRVTSVRFGNELMKVHLWSWREELARLCAESLTESAYDGCFLDTMGNGILLSSYLDSEPIDPRTNQPWTPEQWIKDTGRAVAHVRDQLGVPVAVNGLGSGPRYFARDGYRLADASTHAMPESFLRHPTAAVDHFPTESKFRDEVDMIADVEQRGSGVLAVTKMWVDATQAQLDQWFDFATATLMIGSDGSSRLFFLADGCARPCSSPPRPLAQQPFPDVHLGQPLAPYRTHGSLYARDYQHGTVVVNPSGSSATLPLSGSFTDQHGAIHDGSVVVPAHHALFLTAGASGGGTGGGGGDAGGSATCMGLPATIVGTNDADHLVGTSGPDVIVAMGGNDHIEALGGDDVICAGSGDDVVEAGWGNDEVIGGDGNDDIDGEGGHDVLRGNAGADRLRGGAGNDLVAGNGGNDVLAGNTGDDDLRGSTGIDDCHGGGHDLGDVSRGCETNAYVEDVG